MAGKSSRAAPPDHAVIDEPGLLGVWRADSDKVRLLVTDDRALERLGQLVRSARGRVVTVLPEAAQAVQLLRGERLWSHKALTAMLCLTWRRPLRWCSPRICFSWIS